MIIMNRQRVILSAILTVAFFAVGACDEEGEFVAEPEDDIGNLCAFHSDCVNVCVVDVNGVPPYCSRSCSEQPCPHGYFCVGRGQLGQVCVVARCQTDGECPTGYSCDTDDQICRHQDIPCGSDADCPANIACNQGVCAADCHNDDDCAQGFRCYYHVGACMQCANHSHCSNGFACVEGVCSTACVHEQDCREGYRCVGTACEAIVGNGPGNIGDPCQDHTDCVDFCLRDYCTHTCEAANDPAACPEGFYCEQFSMVCQRSG